MDRDSQEWLRPWRDDSAAAAAGARPASPSEQRPADLSVVRPSRRRASETTRIAPDDGPGATTTARLPDVAAPSPPPPAARSPFAPGGGDDRVPRHAGDPRSVFAPPTQRPQDLDGGPSAPIARSVAPPVAVSGAQPGTGAGRQPGRLRVGIVGLLAGLVGASIGTAATLAVADGRTGEDEAVVADEPDPTTGPDGTDSPSSPVVDASSLGEGDTVVTAVAEAVLPSVVRIDVFVTEDDPDLGEVEVPFGVGSGVVYSDDGYVLTNNHVVAGSDSVTVQLADGSQLQATVVGTDRLTDLAVLRLDASDLTPVTLRVGDPLQVGETAVAIGSPFGLDASVTAGVVSAVNRDLEVPGSADEPAFVIAATIQTDAAINPGNSGGALVDSSGRLIGINTAILTNNGGSQGVGFAIPTGSVVAAADQLIERGFVSHPFLGIAGLDVTNELAARWAEDYDVDLDGGAVVDDVVDGSGAAAAGVRPGDIVVRVGDEPIAGMIDVIAAILRYDTGETVPLVVLRDGERLTLDVTLGQRPREGS